MRNGKRVLAGIAAAGLGAALIPFVGVGVSQGAVTGVTVTAPTAARAGTDAVYNATFNAAADNDVLCVAAISTPGVTFVPASSGLLTPAGATSATITIAGSSIGAPGSYSLAFYEGTNNTPTCPALTTQPILATSTLTVGGSVAAFSIAPAAGSSATATPVTYAVSATDAAGRPTLFGAANATTGFVFPADSYSLASNSTTTTFGGSSATTVVGSSAATFTAQNSVAGTATITATANNGGVTAATATLTTAAAGTAAGVAAIDPTPVSDTVPAGTTSVTFAITGTSAQIGKQFVYSVSGTGATAASNVLSPAATTAPDGSAVATVTVPVTNSAIGRQVTVTPAGVAPATVTMAQRRLTTFTPSVVVAKPGETVSITGTISDQFGDPVPSASVTGEVDAGGSNAGVVTTSALTSSTGAFTVTYPAAAASVADDVVTFAVIQGTYLNFATPPDVTVKFTATGVVNMTSLTFGSANSATAATFVGTLTVPFDGVANTDVTGTGAATGDVVSIRGTAAVAGVPVTYTTSDGFLSTSASTVWNEGKKTVTAASGTSVFFFSTKTGSVSVSATAGGDALSGAVTFVSPQAAARNVEISAAPVKVKPGATSSVTVQVSDVFGNPSALGSGASDANISLQTDLGTLAGGSSVFTLTALNAQGQATVTVTSQVAGLATIIAQGANGQFGATAGNPVGAPAPVNSAATVVEFGEIVEPSITIEGSRSNRNINVTGETVGLAEGTVVRPFLRFPGQTGFQPGNATRTVTIVDPSEEIGEFAWGRKTGKRTAVEIRTEDGLRSNAIVIAAR